MLSALENAIRVHRTTGILVDANVLVLFLVGVFNRDAVEDFKRTRAYSAEDFDVLTLVLGQFDKIVLTPAVVAEASNLCGHLRSDWRDAFFTFLSQLLPTATFTECTVAMPKAVNALCFVRLGFTDATIEEICAAGTPVLTDDLDLYLHLKSRNLEAFNFTQLRPLM